MRSATKVYNGLLWHLREAYGGTGKVDLSRKNLNRILKELPRAKDYYSMSVQLTREGVREAYKSSFALRDVDGALNIYERAFQVSPVKGSGGYVVRPVVRSSHLGWHGVHEPKCEGSLSCTSQGMPPDKSGGGCHASSPFPLLSSFLKEGWVLKETLFLGTKSTTSFFWGL